MTKLLTYEEACDYLTVPRKTMDRWRREGRAPKFYKLAGGRVRISQAQLEAWLEAQVVG